MAEVEACMSAMKLSHLEIVREMEEEYKGIETDMQVPADLLLRGTLRFVLRGT